MSLLHMTFLLFQYEKQPVLKTLDSKVNKTCCSCWRQVPVCACKTLLLFVCELTLKCTKAVIIMWYTFILIKVGGKYKPNQGPLVRVLCCLKWDNGFDLQEVFQISWAFVQEEHTICLWALLAQSTDFYLCQGIHVFAYDGFSVCDHNISNSLTVCRL